MAIVLALCLLASFGQAAWAQAYPVKQIKLVIPFGAGGNVAASFVAKTEPDGYTLLMGSTGNSVNGSLYSNLNYNPDKDLVSVALVGQVPTVLLAHPSLQANTVDELIALAKANPDKLNFASGGSGTTEHLAAAMFNNRAATQIRHIAYRGGAPAMNDLLSGQVQLFFTNQLNALPHVKAGSLKVIGSVSSERSAALPNVPTFIEQGMADFVVSVWWGIFGPAGMPDAAVLRFNQAVNAALKSPDVLAKLESFGATPLGGTPADFNAFFARESSK